MRVLPEIRTSLCLVSFPIALVYISSWRRRSLLLSSVFPLLCCHGPCMHISCSLGSMLRGARGSLISQLKEVTTKHSFGQFRPGCCCPVLIFYLRRISGPPSSLSHLLVIVLTYACRGLIFFWGEGDASLPAIVLLGMLCFVDKISIR